MERLHTDGNRCFPPYREWGEICAFQEVHLLCVCVLYVCFLCILFYAAGPPCVCACMHVCVCV